MSVWLFVVDAPLGMSRSQKSKLDHSAVDLQVECGKGVDNNKFTIGYKKRGHNWQ